MSSDNHRRSFRITVSQEQRKARLRIRGSDLKVVLEDESSGGFAVLAEGQLMLTAGQEGQLQTAAGWSLVRVAHSTSLGAHTRIGFERLEDLPEMEPIKGVWLSYLWSGGERANIGWMSWCVALGICVLVVGGLWRQFTATGRGVAAPAAVEGAGARFFHSFSKDFQKRWKLAHESGAKIELNAKQQSQIGEILFQAEQDILQLRTKGRRNMQAESSRMQAAEEEVLSVLNEKQRAQWDKLGDDSGA